MTWTPGVILPPAALTPDAIAAIKSALAPEHVVAITIWREAEARLEGGRWRANPMEAFLDVLEVIDNRARDRRWAHLGHKGVCLQRWAFSCWEAKGGPDDPRDVDQLAENFETVMAVSQRILAGVHPVGRLHECLLAARLTMHGRDVGHVMPRNTCHYYADTMPAPPKWAIGRTPVLHRWGHKFFAGVP